MKNFIRVLSEMNSQRYSRLINGLISKKIPCGFFTGFDAAQWKVNNALGLKKAGVNLQCICIIDEAQRSNLKADDIPLMTLKELSTLEPKLQRMLYLFSLYEMTFEEYFRRLGIETMVLNDVRKTEERYDAVCRHLDEIFEAYRLLDDEESRAAYRAYLKGSVTNRIGDYRFAPEPQYWLEPFTPVEGDVAIDGGAYDGSTAIDFASRGAKVYAFEMDRKNYERCLSRAEEFNFTIENMGLGSEERTASYASVGFGSYMLSEARESKGSTVESARFTDIDTYVRKKNLPRVDYIKLDIEGAELDCLKGAAKSIVRWKPKLAISAYHKPEDIWTLAPFIRSLRADYKFAFRHYRANLHDEQLSEPQKNILRRLEINHMACNASEMVLYCR